MSYQLTNGSNTLTLNATPNGNYTITVPNSSGTVALTSDIPNVPASVSGYVTTFWKSGTSWYRRWSDGFIDQAGRCTPNNGTISVNFHTGFSNASSICVYGVYRDGGHPDDAYLIMYANNTSSFTCRAPRASNVSWYACGY